MILGGPRHFPPFKRPVSASRSPTLFGEEPVRARDEKLVKLSTADGEHAGTFIDPSINGAVHAHWPGDLDGAEPKGEGGGVGRHDAGIAVCGGRLRRPSAACWHGSMRDGAVGHGGGTGDSGWIAGAVAGQRSCVCPYGHRCPGRRHPAARVCDLSSCRHASQGRNIKASRHRAFRWHGGRVTINSIARRSASSPSLASKGSLISPGSSSPGSSGRVPAVGRRCPCHRLAVFERRVVVVGAGDLGDGGGAVTVTGGAVTVTGGAVRDGRVSGGGAVGLPA